MDIFLTFPKTLGSFCNFSRSFLDSDFRTRTLWFVAVRKNYSENVAFWVHQNHHSESNRVRFQIIPQNVQTDDYSDPVRSPESSGFNQVLHSFIAGLVCCCRRFMTEQISPLIGFGQTGPGGSGASDSDPTSTSQRVKILC